MISIEYGIQQFVEPEQFPFQYSVQVYCSRLAEILHTPDARMCVGLPEASPIDAIRIVFHWRGLTQASSVVVHSGMDMTLTPLVYVDCLFADDLFVSRRLL